MTVRVALLTLLLLPAAAQEKNPVRWKLEAPASAAAGSKMTATLAAAIEPGWHLYSLKELEGGPIATRIRVPAEQSFRLDGKVEAPAPIRKQDEAFGMEVESYEDEVDFTLPLAVAPEAAGAQTLTVEVRYQVCDDKLCLPPRTVKTTAQVQVTK